MFCMRENSRSKICGLICVYGRLKIVFSSPYAYAILRMLQQAKYYKPGFYVLLHINWYNQTNYDEFTKLCNFNVIDTISTNAIIIQLIFLLVAEIRWRERDLKYITISSQNWKYGENVAM